MPKKTAEDARDLPQTYHTYDVQHREGDWSSWRTLDSDIYTEIYDLDEAIMKCDRLNAAPTEGTHFHKDEYRVICIEHTASVHYSPKPKSRKVREANVRKA